MDTGPQQTFLAITTAKNEGPYFLEWLAHHKRIGFTDFLVFQNDSDDLTHETLRTLEDMGEIRYLYNRATKGSHQIRAYKRTAKQAEYQAADWAMVIDMDEFLLLDVPGGTLPDFLNVLPQADQIHINWRLFGSSGHDYFSTEMVTRRFTLCDDPDRVSGRFTGHKTLFKPAMFDRPGIHKPVPKEGVAVKTVNGSGLTEAEFELRNWRSRDPGNRRYAQVNHYVLRDAASFVLKKWRGSPRTAERDIGQRYWTAFNTHTHEDRRLADASGQLEAAMADLDARSGGRLSKLRSQAVKRHIEKFETLRTEPGLAELYQFCLDDIARQAA